MRQNPSKSNLAWQILFGSLLVALSVAALVFLEFDRERKHLEQNLQLTVTALSKAVDIEVETATTGATMLLASNKDLIERKDFAALHAHLSQAMAQARLIEHVALIDRTGQQLINTLMPFGTPLPISKNLDKYVPVFEGGHSSISPLSSGTLSGHHEIFITIPVKLRDQIPYVFVAVVPVSHFNGLLTSLGIPPEWLGNIFDAQGTIIARTRDESKFIGKKVSAGLQAQLAARSYGIFESRNLDNVDSIAAFYHAGTTGLGAAIGVPKELIFWQALEAQLIPGAFIALTVVFFLLAWHYGLALMHQRDTERRFSASLSNAAVGFAMTALDGVFMDCNQAFRDLTGYSADELRILRFQHFIHPDDLPENMVLYGLLARGEIPAFVVENRFVRRDGRVVWVRKSVSMVRGDDFAPRWSFALIEDISDRKQAEMELEEKNKALERSTADLEQFAYVASHDLQTPLRNVVHYTQLLERRYKGNLDSEANLFIGFIVDGGKRMVRLINELLNFARISNLSQALQPVSAEEAVSQALLNLGVAASADDLELKLGTLPEVMAEQSYLVDLFQNLLGNSLKFRAPSRKLVLSISAERDRPGFWRFAVADNGIGISREFHDKIFEIFQRLNPTTDIEGTGIGLTICRRIIHHFGGALWVESAPDSGATFYFTLMDGASSPKPGSAAPSAGSG